MKAIEGHWPRDRQLPSSQLPAAGRVEWERVEVSYLHLVRPVQAASWTSFAENSRRLRLWTEVGALYITLTWSQVLSSGSIWHRAAEANYWHVTQFPLRLPIGLVSSLPSKTMANASGKRIGALIIYCIELTHKILLLFSSEPKWEYS